MSMYSKLKNHPNSEISKKANMFVFSFQAMDFMKVNSTPLPKNTGYETSTNLAARRITTLAWTNLTWEWTRSSRT
uniref:Uncharacterized protein n=1 Tax=Arundo donax TaxID=35708 RepID=A0A0A9CWU0_ARUDO